VWTNLRPGGSAISENARVVLERRYLTRDPAGQIIETPEGMFRRVARAIAEVDRGNEGPSAGARWEEAYFHAMSDLLFLPNSPTLMTAETELGQLAACFVLPVGDSIPEIFGAVRQTAMIQQAGGGTGSGGRDMVSGQSAYSLDVWPRTGGGRRCRCRSSQSAYRAVSACLADDQDYAAAAARWALRQAWSASSGSAFRTC
jgi:ribonucleotide reductase alpha subunit